VKNLPKNIIDIKALKALNKSTHTEGPIITSVDFHPSSTVALVGGTSGILSLFQVCVFNQFKMGILYLITRILRELIDIYSLFYSYVIKFENVSFVHLHCGEKIKVLLRIK